MSLRDYRRGTVLERVKNEPDFTLRNASELLHLSYRQTKRLWAKYHSGGPPAIVHGLLGKPSNRQFKHPQKRRILRICANKYGGGEFDRFGPTLAAEHLAEEEGLSVHHETLRRWLLTEGLWSRRRKRSAHRQRRARKAHFGELVQMDGSFHDWYEGRGPEGCLMNMVDDATGTVLTRMGDEETIEAAGLALQRWISLYGIPKALYTDHRNMYGRDATLEESLEGRSPLSKFGKLCKKLGIEIILAQSPQAKGRVERSNGTHQDRLIKKMRLRGICDHDVANEFLIKKYDREHNAKFAIPPQSHIDFHTPVPPKTDLNSLMALEDFRQVGKDWVISWESRLFQLKPLSIYGPVQGKALVRKHLDGQLSIYYRNKPILFKELSANPTSENPNPHLRARWHPHLKKRWQNRVAQTLFQKVAS